MEPGSQWPDAAGAGEALGDDDLALIQQTFTAYARLSEVTARLAAGELRILLERLQHESLD